MKTTHLLISIFCLLVISCNQGQRTNAPAEPDAELNVYFFHIADRCEACIAIENNTKRVLEEHYKSKMDSNIISFSIFNINDRKNKTITEKYQVSYTSLLLVKDDGSVIDFTNTSFNYANMNPPRFMELLRKEIDKNLK